jgi:copper chaperone CopZ
MAIIKKSFIAEGTTCKSCESTINKQVKKINGVKKVEFDYSKELGYVTFDNKKTNMNKILASVIEKNYTC